MHTNDNPVILLNLNHRSRRHAIDQQHLLGDAHGGMLALCDDEVKLMRHGRVYRGLTADQLGQPQQEEGDKLANHACCCGQLSQE